MQRAVGMICLTVLLALVMIAVLGSNSPLEAQNVTVKIKVNRQVDPPEIDVDEKQMRYPGLCKSGNGSGTNQKKKCDGDQFEWRLLGNPLVDGEKLQILNAPGHPECFSSTNGVVGEFRHDTQGDALTSGEPGDFCSLDKYGTYWPYVIALHGFDASGNFNLLADTDPGGVIFP